MARVEDREGGLILEVGRLTKRGEVKPVRWEILPTGEGLMLYPEPKADKVVWSREEPGVRVDLMQTTALRVKGPQRYWAPGLVRDFAFQPWDWSLQLSPEVTVSLPECSQKRLSYMLRPHTAPRVWGWYCKQGKEYTRARMKGLANFLIRAKDPRPLNVRETVLKYVLWANRPKYLVLGTTCLSCGQLEATSRHGVYECQQATEMWRAATDLMGEVMGVPLAAPSSWPQVVTGLIDLRGMGPLPQEAAQAPGDLVMVWMAIHGATLTSLHHSWCDMRHNGTVPTQAGIWARFRDIMLTTTVTAFKMDVDSDRRVFWASWGKHGVLGQPQRAHHPDTLLALAGAPLHPPT